MKRTLKHWLWWSLSILLWELVLHLRAMPEQPLTLWLAGFSLAAAGIAAFFTGLPGRPGRWLGRILPPVVLLVYYVQLVYCEIFGSYLSFSFVAMGGEAITEFFGVLLSALIGLLPQLLLMALPLVIREVLLRRDRLPGARLKHQAVLAAVSAAALVILGLGAQRQQVNASVDHWAARFGILTAEVLDIRQTITGAGSSFAITTPDIWHNYTQEGWNVLDALDLDEIQNAADSTGDAQLQQLNEYLRSLEPTAKNEYTGYFRGCNLIVLCAESFSPYMIDPDLTPTLYRLSTEGFLFRNFYGSFPNVTTNGEYSLVMGRMPDFSRMSFQMSVNNYQPFALGRLCADRGMTALGYHNNVGTFYHRDQTHPNLGYDFRAINMGLDMKQGSPASDLEMLQKTLDEYIGSEPFHAYYMTYSGHTPYDTTNEMSVQNLDLVADLECSEPLRYYLAANLELERALSYLVQRLEEAGIAERTVIALTGDHIPYGLPEDAYAELAGDASGDPFWQYRNCFLCWKGGMTEPVVVDNYGCTQDILPTLLNLFGFDYDSRLMTGRDLLAPGEHLAILKDGSFLTQGVYYDSITGKAVWEGAEDPQRLQALLQTVDNGFAAANALLATDYSGFAFETMGLYDGGSGEAMLGFSDIEGTWYEQAVRDLYSRGVLNGDSMAKFLGEEPTNRVELLVMLTRGLQMPAVNIPLPYPDQTPGRWFTDGVCISYDAGFLPPEWTELLPGNAVTRDEALYIITRAAEYANIPGSARWARSAIDEVVRLQEEGGFPRDTDTLSRGAVATLVWRLQEERR